MKPSSNRAEAMVVARHAKKSPDRWRLTMDLTEPERQLVASARADGQTPDEIVAHPSLTYVKVAPLEQLERRYEIAKRRGCCPSCSDRRTTR